MTQLWLNGRRMDSIPLLRRFMSACQDEETLLRILGELVRKYQAGRLAGWLIRQSEAQPQPALALRLNEEKTQIPLLLSEPQIPVEEILPALAELCAPERHSAKSILPCSTASWTKRCSIPCPARRKNSS